MSKQTLSTFAFMGGGVMLVLFVFQVVPAKTAIIYGGALTVLGYAIQPATTSQAV